MMRQICESLKIIYWKLLENNLWTLIDFAPSDMYKHIYIQYLRDKVLNQEVANT